MPYASSSATPASAALCKQRNSPTRTAPVLLSARNMDLFEPISEQQLDLALQLKGLVQDVVLVRREEKRGHLSGAPWRRASVHVYSSATFNVLLLDSAPGDAPAGDRVGAGGEGGGTGKTFVSPHADKEGRPVVVMRPRNQNTRDEKEQVMFLIYCLEHASRLADEQREWWLHRCAA
ncbi:hypothetical protein COO60DRAFT_1541839, partial [Scenedesmus sp. NREL 46B-D3]